ncbi:MAG: CinA family protein [Desulfitobacteriaceae bacterium]|nr:CinA family protein [Desulfitobacteriaceae bacterium]MDD4751805.1 CinA family protein [Desulfitobacteriaceae bacterium]
MEEALVIKMMKEKGLTIALAESCTGGLVSGAITAVPGSSECFGYGVVTYSNEAKNKLLNVPREVLDKYGAVSPETAVLMAQGVRRLAQSDIGLSITGIAGPSGGSAEKPVGLVFFAFANETSCICEKFNFQGNRDEVRKSTVRQAFNMIWHYGVLPR